MATLADSDNHVMTVFKSPTCGCCGNWVERIRAAGFKVNVTNTDNLDAVKKMASIPSHLQSCHTAKIDGYIVEGHVPVDVIRKLLKERPEIRGISVPGMPTGSPGMEYGDEREAFDVVTFGGKVPGKIYRSYPAK